MAAKENAKQVRICMKSTANGPKYGLLEAGQEYDIDADTAKAFIDGGFAEEVKNYKKPKVEVAATDDGEVAGEDSPSLIDRLNPKKGRS